MVDQLLKAGADPTWTKGGESAVDWALKTGNTDIAAKVMKAQAQVGFGRSSVLAEQDEDDEEDQPDNGMGSAGQSEVVGQGKK